MAGALSELIRSCWSRTAGGSHHDVRVLLSEATDRAAGADAAPIEAAARKRCGASTWRCVGAAVKTTTGDGWPCAAGEVIPARTLVWRRECRRHAHHALGLPTLAQGRVVVGPRAGAGSPHVCVSATPPTPKPNGRPVPMMPRSPFRWPDGRRQHRRQLRGEAPVPFPVSGSGIACDHRRNAAVAYMAARGVQSFLAGWCG